MKFENLWFEIYLKLLKLLRLFRLVDKKTYNKKRHVLIIKKSALFDRIYYKKQYSDVDFSKITPEEHYLTIGYKEGANPSAHFSTEEYYNENPDVKVAGMNPLLHYEISGKNEGRGLQAIDDFDYKMTLWQKIYFELTGLLGKIIYKKEIESNKKTKVLVCLHIYYMDAWPTIEKYLKNLSVYPYDLIVTYIDNHYNQEILDKIKIFKPDTKFYEYPNQGFDIGSFLDVLQKIDLNAYDIVFKIHTKGVKRSKIFIYNQVFKFKDWFFNLYDGILGGISVHQVIKVLTGDRKIGFVAAENLIIEDPKHKKFLTNKIAQEMGIKIKDNYHYVAGTCLACNAKALVKIKKLNLTIKSFEKVKRGEFSKAHAMERILCAMMETQGYKFYGIKTKHHQYKKELSKCKSTSALPLLDDDRFTLDYDFFYKSLEMRPIQNYNVHKIRIGDINRKWIDGNAYKLRETSPYMYLLGDKQRYQNYCQINSQVSPFEMSEGKFNNLIASLDMGYDVKRMPIICGDDNMLMDGQHRLCYLLKKYGEDYEINCLHIDSCSQTTNFNSKAKEIIWENENICFKKMKRIAIFASFSSKGIIEDYVIYYLNGLRKVCDGIIFITDNPLIEKEIDKIKDLVIYINASRHGEYDFGSYKKGYYYLKQKKVLANIDELVFCNDSCYAPVYPFVRMFKKMSSKKVDFWGICANDMFKYHLQSYFLVFHKKVVNSSAFKKFMELIKKENNRRDVILNYEVKLTEILQENGFSQESYIPFLPKDDEYPYKFSHNQTYCPIFLMKQECPTIKIKTVESFGKNYDGHRETIRYIKKYNKELYKILPRKVRWHIKEKNVA